MQGGKGDGHGIGLTNRQAVKKKSLGLGLGPNINPKTARVGRERMRAQRIPLCPQLDLTKFPS